jgi:hydrogenase-4 component B
MDLFLIAIGLILLGGFGALVFHFNFSLFKFFSIFLIVAGCVVGIQQALIFLFQAQPWTFNNLSFGGYSLCFSVDNLSAFFLLPIFLISALSSLFSYHYLDNIQKNLRIAINYFFFSLLVVSMVLVVCSDNMITFALSWEIMSISSFFLVMYDYEKEQTRTAGLIYFIFTQAGALIIFLAFGILAANSHQIDFAVLESVSDGVKIATFILLLIGLGSKAGVFPLHIWLPYAHPAAPSHVSALMSGVMIKVGIYGIIRFFFLLKPDALIIGVIILVLGILSGILGVMFALGQHDLKRLLAYHSVENIGIILIGTGIGIIGVSIENDLITTLGFAGALLHVINHALFKSLLFLGAGMVLHKTGTASLDQLGGLLKKMRVTGITFLIGSLAISGLPVFNGFVSEFLIYLAGFNALKPNQHIILFSIFTIISLALIGGLALACFTKVFGIVFLGEPRKPFETEINEKGMTMLIAMSCLAVACIFIGIFPSMFIRATLRALQSITSIADGRIIGFLDTVGYQISMFGIIILGIIIFMLLIRTLIYRNKSISFSGTWGCGFSRPTPRMQYSATSFAFSIISFFKPVTPLEEHYTSPKSIFPSHRQYHSKNHDCADIIIQQGMTKPIIFLLDKLRWIQHGDIHLYIGYILFTIIILLIFI